MARISTFETATDTSQFTAMQLQPKTLLSLTWNGYARWLREHLISFPNLIKDHGFGTAVLGISIDYLEPLSFFDSDTLSVTVSLKVRREASRIQVSTDFFGAGKHAAQASLLLCPLEIGDPETLAAAPTRVPESLLVRFSADEIDPTSPERQVPNMVREINYSGILLTEGEGGFTIHHHLCEVAEQWSFIEVPNIVESVREPLALDTHEEIPAMRQCLSQPLRRFNVELNRPYFVFESGQVKTQAYLLQGRLTFVHQLFSAEGTDEVYGTIIEEY